MAEKLTEKYIHDALDGFIKNTVAASAPHGAHPESLIFICRDSKGNIGFGTCGLPLNLAEKLGVFQHAQHALYHASTDGVTELKLKADKEEGQKMMPAAKLAWSQDAEKATCF